MGRDGTEVSTRQETETKIRKKITTRSAKAKGRSLQKWVCQKIADLTGYEWGQDKPIESRGMGQSGCDVRMEEDVQKLFPFSVECKWQETWSIPAWIEQAKANEKPGTDWLLVCKKNRQCPVVILDAEVFFRLMAEVRHDKKINT